MQPRTDFRRRSPAGRQHGATGTTRLGTRIGIGVSRCSSLYGVHVPVVCMCVVCSQLRGCCGCHPALPASAAHAAAGSERPASKGACLLRTAPDAAPPAAAPCGPCRRRPPLPRSSPRRPSLSAAGPPGGTQPGTSDRRHATQQGPPAQHPACCLLTWRAGHGPAPGADAHPPGGCPGEAAEAPHRARRNRRGSPQRQRLRLGASSTAADRHAARVPRSKGLAARARPRPVPAAVTLDPSSDRTSRRPMHGGTVRRCLPLLPPAAPQLLLFLSQRLTGVRSLLLDSEKC